MKKFNNQNTTKAALFAGATAFMALACQSHAQSAGDALVDKLEQKGILTADEAKQLREENKQDFAGSFTNNFGQAFNQATGTPDWVTGYKFSGDFRGRFEDVASTDNNKNFTDRVRYRYRLRVGLVVTMKDNLETGFRITSGDSAPGSGYGGNPLSNTSTFQDNGTKKNVYIDTAYGKWTALNDGDWLLAATIGKMDNPLQFTPMIFDADWTPEGAALQGGYTFNDQHSIIFNGGAFVEDQEVNSSDVGSVRAPGLLGWQAAWNANWTKRFGTSLGIGGYSIVNPVNLTTANVPYVNQGNSRFLYIKNNPDGSVSSAYVLANNYTPIIADASATYKVDSFPLYPGAFPIRVAGEYVNNTSARTDNNQGYWVGVTFGKSGKKHAWDISYRYEYLEADAVYDQLVDDDNGVYYQNPNPPTAILNGYYGGTNIKGYLIKANYSLTDSLTFTFTCYLNQLINGNLNTAPAPNTAPLGEPKNAAIHVMADLMWKF